MVKRTLLFWTSLILLFVVFPFGWTLLQVGTVRLGFPFRYYYASSAAPTIRPPTYFSGWALLANLAIYGLLALALAWIVQRRASRPNGDS